MKVKLDIGLNDVQSLIKYLALLGDKQCERYRLLASADSPLHSADLLGAARCLEPLRKAVKKAKASTAATK